MAGAGGAREPLSQQRGMNGKVRDDCPVTGVAVIGDRPLSG
jgi:hypothetical protein